jgi:hypothetical protein
VQRFGYAPPFFLLRLQDGVQQFLLAFQPHSQVFFLHALAGRNVLEARHHPVAQLYARDAEPVVEAFTGVVLLKVGRTARVHHRLQPVEDARGPQARVQFEQAAAGQGAAGKLFEERVGQAARKVGNLAPGVAHGVQHQQARQHGAHHRLQQVGLFPGGHFGPVPAR